MNSENNAVTMVPTTIELPFEQAVILVMGGTFNTATVLFDTTASDDLDLTPIQRAVWGARLRSMADRIDP